MRGVDRTPYLGDVAVVVHPGKKEMGTPLADTPTRPVTRHGGMRDLHESSFSLSGKGEGVVGAGRQDKVQVVGYSLQVLCSAVRRPARAVGDIQAERPGRARLAHQRLDRPQSTRRSPWCCFCPLKPLEDIAHRCPDVQMLRRTALPAVVVPSPSQPH